MITLLVKPSARSHIGGRKADMSRRRAAKAARVNIRDQLNDDGPHVTEYSETKSYDQVNIKEEPQDNIKEEPQEGDGEDEMTWRHVPIPNEQEDHGITDSGNSADSEEEREASSANIGIIARSPPIMLQKTAMLKRSYDNNKVPVTTPAEVADPSSANNAVPKISTKNMKIKAPIKSRNVKVKVIKACPKCTPVVMELAEKANKATKEIQDQNKLIKSYKQNIDSCQSLLDETVWKNQNLERRVGSLQETNLSFTDSVMESDHQMQIFCGINMCKQFKWIFEKARSRLSTETAIMLGQITISSVEQLLVVFMYLRCNPSVEELTQRLQFRITPKDVMTLLEEWLPVLVEELKSRIMKPQNCILNTNFPKCFDSVGRNLQGIVHKLEIIREKPALWDDGQTSHCLKCIVAMSLKGGVMGVSQVVDQTVSDVELFAFSDLNKLFGPPNMIIDSQAIGLKDIVPYGVKVLQPPFGEEMMPCACNHIETIVSRLKEFRILQGPIPRTMSKQMMDQIVLVCCGMINLADESQAYLRP